MYEARKGDTYHNVPVSQARSHFVYRGTRTMGSNSSQSPNLLSEKHVGTCRWAEKKGKIAFPNIPALSLAKSK